MRVVNTFFAGFDTLALFPTSGHVVPMPMPMRMPTSRPAQQIPGPELKQRPSNELGRETQPDFVGIEEFAHAELPPLHYQGSNPARLFQLSTPIIVDGVVVPNDTDILETFNASSPSPTSTPVEQRMQQLWFQSPPDDLLSRHAWGAAEDFPSFESPGAVSVRDPPFNAVGNGVTDDTAAIAAALAQHDIVVLPRGMCVCCVHAQRSAHALRKVASLGEDALS